MKKEKAEIVQPALIGGVYGILLGTSGELLAQNVIDDEITPEQEDVTVQDDSHGAVIEDDGQSFSEAFAAARAEFGAGGVFEWHGNLYSTYYAEEWNAMSDEQRDEYMHWALNGGDTEPVDDPTQEDIIDIDDDIHEVIYGPPPADDDPVYEDVYGPPSYYDDDMADDGIDNMD